MHDGLSVNSLVKTHRRGYAACPIKGQRKMIVPFVFIGVKDGYPQLKLFAQSKQSGREPGRFTALFIFTKLDHLTSVGHGFNR
jgi:hypothetical protein